MAISEDTAALVAAQLTVAWATRVGFNDEGSVAGQQTKIFEVYEAFNARVRSPKAGSYSIDSF